VTDDLKIIIRRTPAGVVTSTPVPAAPGHRVALPVLAVLLADVSPARLAALADAGFGGELDQARRAVAWWRATQTPPPADVEPNAWTVSQAAQALGTTTRTVQRWLRFGRLSGTQVVVRGAWSVDPDSVRRLMNPRR
jgi:hypothetical protein